MTAWAYHHQDLDEPPYPDRSRVLRPAVLLGECEGWCGEHRSQEARDGDAAHAGDDAWYWVQFQRFDVRRLPTIVWMMIDMRIRRQDVVVTDPLEETDPVGDSALVLFDRGQDG